VNTSTPISPSRPWYECRNSAPWKLHYFLLDWPGMPVGSVGYHVLGTRTLLVSKVYP
jgi:hypothetical protein